MTSHALYSWHHSLYIWHYIHCICVIKNSVSIKPCPLSVWHHTLYVWHHIQYACHHINCLWYHTHIGTTSHPVYLWHHIQYLWYHPYCIHENTTTIPDISPTIFDITSTASVWSHPLYGCNHNNYGSHHTWHTYDIILYITFTLYDINIQYLWHHKHCIHDIRSPKYDIIWTVYDISSPIPVIPQPLYQ